MANLGREIVRADAGIPGDRAISLWLQGENSLAQIPEQGFNGAVARDPHLIPPVIGLTVPAADLKGGEMKLTQTINRLFLVQGLLALGMAAEHCVVFFFLLPGSGPGGSLWFAFVQLGVVLPLWGVLFFLLTLAPLILVLVSKERDGKLTRLVIFSFLVGSTALLLANLVYLQALLPWPGVDAGIRVLVVSALIYGAGALFVTVWRIPRVGTGPYSTFQSLLASKMNRRILIVGGGLAIGAAIVLVVASDGRKTGLKAIRDPFLARCIKDQLRGRSFEHMKRLICSPEGKETERVTNLAGLEGLTRLSELGLAHAEVEDFSPLAGLTQLEKLDLSGTNIRDLSVLSRLAHLKYLSLRDTPITDIAPLSGLPNLVNLHIPRTNVRDLTPIAGLRHLTVLSIENDLGITDVSMLSEMTSLETLWAEQTGLKQIDLETGFPSLKKLRLWRSFSFACDQLSRIRAKRPGLRIDQDQKCPR